MWILPDRDSEGRRVIILNGQYIETTRCSLVEFQRLAYLLLHRCIREVETQICGFVVIEDMSGKSVLITFSTL